MIVFALTSSCIILLHFFFNSTVKLLFIVAITVTHLKERWANKPTDCCSFQSTKQQSTLVMWPQSFPQRNHIFIIVTMTTGPPHIKEVVNCTPNHNVFLKLNQVNNVPKPLTTPIQLSHFLAFCFQQQFIEALKG